MDHKQFQNWVSGVDGLSPPQRQQTQDLTANARFVIGGNR